MARSSFSQDQVGRAALATPAAIDPTDGSQTANHDNSTNPASATLSNTTTSYSTLGGRFQFAAVAGSATDYNLFSYMVPEGFRLLITGISISTMITGVAVVTATVLDWSLGLKSPFQNLASSSLRRIPLGTQGFLALAGIGSAGAPDLVREFDPELVVEHGERVNIILQIPNVAATINLVYRGDVLIHGYFEKVL